MLENYTLLASKTCSVVKDWIIYRTGYALVFGVFLLTPLIEYGKSFHQFKRNALQHNKS